MPGGLATSSARTSSRPWVEKTSTAYSCSFVQWRCISCSDETSCAQRFLPTCVASVPSSTSNESPRECAGSVLMTTVRYPAAAQRTAVAAATEVLPTPPFPVNRTTRTPRVYVRLRAGGFPPFAGRDQFVDVLLDQGLDVLEDLDRDLGVLFCHLGHIFDRLEDLHVLLVGLVRLRSRVLEREPVLLRLPVAGEQKHGTGVCGLGRESQVEQDVGIRVDVDAAGRLQGVDRHPRGDEQRLHDEKAPRADERCDPVGELLPERRLLVVEDVDGVLVGVGGVPTAAACLGQRGVRGVAGADRHGGSKLYRFDSGFLLPYLTIEGSTTEPAPSRTIVTTPTKPRRFRSLVK